MRVPADMPLEVCDSKLWKGNKTRSWRKNRVLPPFEKEVRLGTEISGFTITANVSDSSLLEPLIKTHQISKFNISIVDSLLIYYWLDIVDQKPTPFRVKKFNLITVLSDGSQFAVGLVTHQTATASPLDV